MLSTSLLMCVVASKLFYAKYSFAHVCCKGENTHNIMHKMCCNGEDTHALMHIVNYIKGKINGLF